MTSNINNKRQADFPAYPPKKLLFDPSNALVDFIYTNHQRVPITTLFSLSLIDKALSEVVDRVFLESAQAIGLNRRDNGSPKRKWAQLVSFLFTVKIFDLRKEMRFPLKMAENSFDNIPFSTCIQYFTAMKIAKILMITSLPQIYEVPDNPLLELLEIENSWNSAEVQFKKILEQHSIGKNPPHFAHKFKLQSHRALSLAISKRNITLESAFKIQRSC